MNSIFNASMSLSEARRALYSSFVGKTKDERKNILAEYNSILDVLLSRELALAKRGAMTS